MQIGWIGLGSMGKPMALSARRGGHALHGYARRPREHDELRAAGAVVDNDLHATVAAADIVCVNLFSEAQLLEVLVDGGALASMPPGAILAIHSTVGAAFVRDLAVHRPDIAVLDAGFSGGPDDAAAGRLTLMVGGAAAVLEQARPVFSTYANYIAHAGALGAGMALKVINNLMFAANIVVARDALRLVQAAGLALPVAVATLSRGSAGSTALGILGRGDNLEAVVTVVSHYLKKDVPIALAGAQGLHLGTLASTTSEFQPG